MWEKTRRGGLIAGVVVLAGCGMAMADEEMTFELVKGKPGCDRCEWISAGGEIMEDTPDRFVQFLSRTGLLGADRPLVVYLDSPGGNLVSGIKLGGLIRREGLHTSIGRTTKDRGGVASIKPAKCASACSFAFLGGTVRSAGAGELGVHQFYDAEALADPSAKSFDATAMSTQQLLGAIIINFVVRMGVDPRVASIAASTMPDDLHYFDDEELEDLRINWDPHAFGAWQLSLVGSGVEAVSRSNDGTRSLALYCTRADEVPHLRLKGLGDRTKATLDAVRERGGLDAFGWIVDQSDVAIIEEDEDGAVELTLEGFQPESVAGKEALLVGDETGGSIPADFPNVVTPGEDARRAFAIALKNCI